MADKNSIEFQVKNLEKGMGTIVKAFKDLKASVKALEDKIDNAQNEEVREILRNQKVLQDIISANSDAIKRIDIEIAKHKDNSQKAYPEKKDKESENKEKKCRYFNKGHCKYKTVCRFSHPSEV